MAKKVFAVPVKRVLYGEVLVWAKDEHEAKQIALDNEGHYNTSDGVIQDDDNYFRFWQVCDDQAYESDYHDDCECFNYEEQDEDDDDE